MLERIGRGGMGAVYRGWHPVMKKAVAVKILPRNRLADPQAVARLRREVEAVAQLDHPNIVRATDAGEHDGVPFLVMELVDGVDLGVLVRRHGPVPVADACELVRQAALGLQHAHERGMVHRDVKPQNLMLTRKGELKVLDLGLALLRADGPANGLTPSGYLLGTPDYMAPEHWEACHAVDTRADVYSLGCTLYALLTGAPPFGGPGYDSHLRKMAGHARDPVPPVATVRPDTPAPWSLCSPACSRRLRPTDRPSRPRWRGARPIRPQGQPRVAVRVGLPRRGIDRGRDAVARRGVGAPPDRRGRCPDRDGRGPGISLPSVRDPPRRGRGRAPRHRRGGVARVQTARRSRRPGHARRGCARRPHCRARRRAGARPAGTKGWQNLLVARPVAKVWPVARGARLDHDGVAEQLRVETPKTALVRLGETSARGYKLQIGFQQIRWTAGFGVYLGGCAGGPGEFRFQLVHLRRFEAGDDRAFTLGRSTGSAQDVPGGDPVVSNQGFASSVLPRPPGAAEQLLEIEVRPRRGMVSARWNGVPCPELVANAANERFQETDYRGEFGIYANGTTVTVFTARLHETE